MPPPSKVAEKIGPIDFDPDGRCDPMDVAKHLTSDYIMKNWIVDLHELKVGAKKIRDLLKPSSLNDYQGLHFG